MIKKARVLAFYLPQFHEIPENNEWWGKGFTEWTSVKGARPLFKGHVQPKIPGELGYYNLLDPDIRERQAQLAREAGIEGFIYWHYWFGNGKRLLERVFDEVLESGKPDFPFCLGWANHSWYAKRWNKDVAEDKLLIEQTYPGVEDARMHFEYLLKAFIRSLCACCRLLDSAFSKNEYSCLNISRITLQELSLTFTLSSYPFWINRLLK